MNARSLALIGVAGLLVGGCGEPSAPTLPALTVEIRSVVPNDSVFALDTVVMIGAASAPDLGVLPDDSLWWTEDGRVVDSGPITRVRVTAGSHGFILHARYGARDGSALRTLSVLGGGLGRVLWRVPLDSNPADGLALSPDGTTLYASDQGGATAVAIGLDGSVLWRRGLGLTFRDQLPAVGPNGSLYYPYLGGPSGGPVDESGGVLALAADGTTRWVFVTADHSPRSLRDSIQDDYTIDGGVAVDASGRVFFPSEEYGAPMYSLTSSGNLRWRRETPQVSWFDGGFTVLVADSLVVALPRDSAFPAFTTDSGIRRWGADIRKGAWCARGPAVGPNGDLYVPQDAGWALNAYRPDGTLRWSKSLPEQLVAGEPVVGVDRIYLASIRGAVLVLSLAGDSIAAFGPPLVYAWPPSDYFRDGLTLGAHGVLYIAGQDTLFSYDSTGTRRFATAIPHNVPDLNLCWQSQGGPVIGADGTVYVRASDYGVIAIRDTVGPATDAPWPTLQGSFLRAGRRATDY